MGGIGLLMDIVGAFLLAESFVLKRRDQIVRETNSYWDGNPYSLRSACYQAIEARAGFAHLALGFSAQFVSYTDRLQQGPNRLVLACVIGGLLYGALAVTVVHRVARWYSRRTTSTEMADGVERQLGEAEDADKLQSLASFYAPVFDLVQMPGESAADFAARIIERTGSWRRK